jgi:hypothetical protein
VNLLINVISPHGLHWLETLQVDPEAQVVQPVKPNHSQCRDEQCSNETTDQSLRIESIWRQCILSEKNRG